MIRINRTSISGKLLGGKLIIAIVLFFLELKVVFVKLREELISTIRKVVVVVVVEG